VRHTKKANAEKPKQLFLAFALKNLVNKNIKTAQPKQQTLLPCTVK